jgi:hypothetical protein
LNKKFELGTELAETARSAQAPQSGIKNLAQAFPDKIVGEHGDENGETWKHREPPSKSRGTGFL